MTWDDTDITELDKHIDEIEENAYNLGVLVGKGLERQRIIEMLQDMESESAVPLPLGVCVWTKQIITKISKEG